MADISAGMVMELRKATGAGMMDCKKALGEAEGSFDKAVELLQIKKKATAAKKQGRIAAEGRVDSYVHMGGRIGVLCEVNCETDFVAKNETFEAFVRDICMHIAAMNPAVVDVDDYPDELIERQTRIFEAQVAEEGRPEKLAERILQGKLDKWKKESALLEQKFVKDPEKTVKGYLAEVTGDIGEKLTIRRFVRFEMGEGLEKKKHNLAEEVAATIGG